MRVGRTASPDFHKCWFPTTEYQALRRTTHSSRDEIIVCLGGEIGLRSFEFPQITPTPFAVQ